MAKKIKSTKPPISDEILKFNFKKYFSETINENVKFYYFGDKNQPLFSLRLFSKNDALYTALPGLANLAAQLTTKGTRKFTSLKIAEEVDYIGGNVNGSSSSDAIIWTIESLSKYTEKAIKILSACINEPSFPEKETDIMKSRTIADIRQQKAEPAYLAKLAFLRAFYQNHPYCYPAVGTEQIIQELNSESCSEWHFNLLEESKFTIIASGNIENRELLNLISKYFSFKNLKPKKSNYLHAKTDDSSKIVVAKKPGAEQTAIRIGIKSIGPEHPDYPALTLANTLFGGFFMSRLNAVLREKHGYTYGVHSFIDHRILNSSLIITTSVKKSATRDSIRIIIDEMEKFSKYKVSKEEFQRARRYNLGSFLRNTETNFQLMSLLGTIDLFNLKKKFFENSYNSIAALGIDDLFKIQKKYFKPENLTIAAAGDTKYFTKELKVFGDVNEIEIK